MRDVVTLMGWCKKRVPKLNKSKQRRIEGVKFWSSCDNARIEYPPSIEGNELNEGNSLGQVCTGYELT